MILKFILLAALVRLLIATDKPFLCSGIYAGVGFIFGAAFGGTVLGSLISAGIGFALASVYKWRREGDSNPRYSLTRITV
jgi:hypothetical protein